MARKQLALIILDGWGIAQTWAGNAIGLADTPTMDYIAENFPYTTLEASGSAVGLPFGESGNSEVGHLNIGAGRIAKQGLTAINQTIDDGSFFENSVLHQVMDNAVKNNKNLHMIGLLSDGGIHSHIKQLFALLELAKKQKAQKVYIHIITDGRDSPSTSGIKYFEKLESKIDELKVGKIASISGRYYAMDRDQHWDRVEKAYEAMMGNGNYEANPKSVILKSYANGITDEFILPAFVDKKGAIADGDSVIFFNYRSDRSRQIINVLANKDFSGFKRKEKAKNLLIASFSSYLEGIDLQLPFESREVSSPLASILSENKLSHLHAAETEKYAHVTYFFNGGKEAPFEGESRILVPSPNVKTYDLKPEMSAEKIVGKVMPVLSKYDFTVINFANADMVGHTGNLEAAIKAVETVDKCLKKVLDKIFRLGMVGLVTADHGNAEQMINPLTGQEDTEHTTNLVPFSIISKDKNRFNRLIEDGKLSDISTTVLEIMNIEKSKEMAGRVLFR